MSDAGFVGREWVLAQVDVWCADADDSRPLLLTGPPGSGKSTLARHLVELADQPDERYPHLPTGQLVLAHVCVTRDDRSLDPIRFITRLSQALAQRFPPFAQALAMQGPEIVVTGEAHAGDAGHAGTVIGLNITNLVITDRSPRRAYARAVRQPLEALRAAGEHRALYVLIDGLDEALTYGNENIVEILRTAIPTSAGPGERLRFLLTSRSGDRRVLEGLERKIIDLSPEASADDVARYIRAGVDQRLPEGAIGRERIISSLTQASDGNFLYAYHALSALDADAGLPDLPRGLPDLYKSFIDRELRLDRLGTEWLQIHRPVLAVLSAARGGGVNRQQITGSTGLRLAEVTRTLDRCGQYLAPFGPDDPVTFYHRSFRDFLTTDADLGVLDEQPDARIAHFLQAEHAAGGSGADARYSLEYLPAHLAAAVAAEPIATRREQERERLAAIVGDVAFLEQKALAFGVDAVATDLRMACAQAAVAEPETMTLEALASQVRDWTGSEPAFFAQQLLDAATRCGADRLARHALARLTELGLPFFRRLWDSQDDPPALERRLFGHDAGVAALAVLPTGELASSSYDSTVRIWDWRRGTLVRTITVPALSVGALTTLGSMLVAGTGGGEIVVLDPASGAVPARWPAHGGDPRPGWGGPAITALAVAGDGQLFSATSDHRICAWRAGHDGEQDFELAGHDHPVTAMAAAGDRLLSADESGAVMMWDLTSRSGRRLADVIGAVHALAVDGETVAIGCASGDVQLGSLAVERAADHAADRMSEGWRRVIGRHREPVRAVMFHGGTLFSASDDGSVRQWQVDSGECLGVLTAHEGYAQALAALSDGTIASAHSLDAIAVWNLDRGLPDDQGAPAGVAYAMARRGDQILSAFEDGTVSSWDLGSGAALEHLTSHAGVARAVVALPDGRVVTGGDDGVLNLVSATTSSVVVPRSAPITHLLLAPDQRRVLVAADAIYAFDPDSSSLDKVMFGFMHPPSALAANDNSWVVAGADRGVHDLKNLDSGATWYVRPGPDGFWNTAPRNVALTADNLLISDSADQQADGDLPHVRVWDVEAQELVARYRSESTLHAMTLDGEGRLWTGARNRSIRVLDPATGRTILRFILDRVPTSLLLLPDGPGLVISDMSGRISRWELAGHLPG